MVANSMPSTMGLLLLALFATSIQAQLSQTLCSNQNTGENSRPNYSIYQSNGLCFDSCKSEYAYAVVQYQNCWCSNYAPANTVDSGDCSQQCPGFPDELCGNEGSGLFGYIALTREPSGTAGASPTRTQTRPEQTRPPRPTSDDSPPSTSSEEPSTSAPPSTTESSTSSTVSTTESETPVTSTQVVTVSGAIVTQTVTSTPRPRVTGTAADNLQERPSQSNTPTGVIVGAVIGSLAGLAFVLLALFLLWRRRRGDRRNSGTGSNRINRNASILSKAGLLATGRNNDAEKSMEEPRYGSQRQSALYDPPESPISAPGGVYETSSHPSRRNSRPLVYDQRLNPAAIMQDWEGNGSRTSIGTMQDQRDYSRPLGVTNPDVDR